MTTNDTTPTVLQTKHLAAKYGMKPIQLRRILRSMPAYADGVHTNYAWDPTKDKRALEAIDREVAKRKEARAAKAQPTDPTVLAASFADVEAK